jgi:hypothetical protein
LEEIVLQIASQPLKCEWCSLAVGIYWAWMMYESLNAQGKKRYKQGNGKEKSIER